MPTTSVTADDASYQDEDDAPVKKDRVTWRRNPARAYSAIYSCILRCPEISAHAVRLYGCLVSHDLDRDGFVHPAREVLAAYLGRDTNRVDIYLAELKRIDLVRVTQRGLRRSNEYELLDPEEWTLRSLVDLAKRDHLLPPGWRIPAKKTPPESSKTRSQESSKTRSQESSETRSPIREKKTREKKTREGRGAEGCAPAGAPTAQAPGEEETAQQERTQEEEEGSLADMPENAAATIAPPPMTEEERETLYREASAAMARNPAAALTTQAFFLIGIRPSDERALYGEWLGKFARLRKKHPDMKSGDWWRLQRWVLTNLGRQPGQHYDPNYLIRDRPFWRKDGCNEQHYTARNEREGKGGKGAALTVTETHARTIIRDARCVGCGEVVGDAHNIDCRIGRTGTPVREEDSRERAS